MPSLHHLFQMLRSWRIDTEEETPSHLTMPHLHSPSTPIITVMPSVDVPEKINMYPEEKLERSETSSPADRWTLKKPFNWIMTSVRSFSPASSGLKSATGTNGELQTMLPTSVKIHRTSNAGRPPEDNGGICLMTESPFRILRVAECGNLETFQRLYFADTSRLSVKDSRGRTAAHQAAAKNKINILQFILSQGGDLNNQDNAGNTPLHIAVEHESLDAVDFLLQSGVKTNILNEKKQAVIHLVTELNKVAVLEVMGKHKSQIDIQQGGEHGRTALHIAAIYDHEDCARLLINEFDACPRRPCNNGYYPIHEAAKNASSKTLEIFLQWGESRGSSREEMISFYDSEGNVPLHSAVHGGDIKAVELCLTSGAKISTQQHDLSTPVHLACAQGATEIVKLMFKLQPEEKLTCLASCDVQKMTPLHCAAMFDHPEIVEFLIAEGADINPMDKERRSPLLLAALRGGWRTVHTLIRLGADINIKDVNRRNVLHLVVMNGGRLEQFAAEVSKTKSQTSLLQLLNEKDINGCSPLHYASREGHIRSLENLIKLGACINLKNNNNESPLHFAARYGRYNTVRQLLDSEKGTFIINESDGEGMTPLHIASKQGHTRVVQLLLNRGALLHRDHNGRNPLHLAAMNGYTQTIELLLSVHSHLLDQADKDGNTALHLATMENKPNSIALLLSMSCKLLYNQMEMSAIDYAIYYKFPEAALAMVTHEDRAQEVMSLKSNKHPYVTLALIASMPKVFEAVQDKCITKANCKKDSKSFYIKYNFSALQCSQFYADMDSKTGDALTISKPIPLPALNAMVSHGRVELLAHPLSQKYLQMKWNSYGKYFHLANVLFYSIFLTFVTTFSYEMMKHDEPMNLNITANLTNMTHDEYVSYSKANILEVKITPLMYMSALAIITYIVLNSVREMIQMYQQKYMYFMDPINLVSWLLYSSAVVMVTPIFWGTMYESQFSCASLTVFLSWFNLLLLLQRFDQVGIYVVMFLEILQTLIKVLMVFSILIIAFGLAFYILLSRNKIHIAGERRRKTAASNIALKLQYIVGPLSQELVQPPLYHLSTGSISSKQKIRGDHLSFKTIPMSLVRTFSMMLGEIDFLGTYVKPYYMTTEDERSFLPFPIPAFFILAIFMVLMPILLMNLLIGLAVGDIESVRRNAQLKRLAMQVVLHTELERKLPKMLMERVDKSELIEYPNDTKCKLGFFDSILRKWFGNPFSDEGLDMVMDSGEDYVVQELEKTKRKLRDISVALDTQQQFLRLIVQKMEIKTEADDVDEGVSPNDMNNQMGGHSNKWTSPKIRKKLRSISSFNNKGT